MTIEINVNQKSHFIGLIGKKDTIFTIQKNKYIIKSTNIYFNT